MLFSISSSSSSSPCLGLCFLCFFCSRLYLFALPLLLAAVVISVDVGNRLYCTFVRFTDRDVCSFVVRSSCSSVHTIHIISFSNKSHTNKEKKSAQECKRCEEERERGREKMMTHRERSTNKN